MYEDIISELFSEVFYGKQSTITDDLKLYNYTDKFYDVIRDNASNPGFGGIIFTMGTTGGGKTAQMFIFQNFFLNYSPERNVAFYRAPDDLLKAIKKHAPKKIYTRYRIIDKLREVDQLDLLSLDEGYLDASAKEALRKGQRNFEKSITALRHHGVFTILNALDDGVLKGYRKKANIKIYKLLPLGFIEESNSFFLKKFKNDLISLRPQESIFEISHPFFIKRNIHRGVIINDLKDYCPWFHDDISRSMENQSFDFDYQKAINLQEQINPLIDTLLKEADKSELKQKANSTYIKGWLSLNRPDLYYDHNQHISLVGNQIYVILKETEKMELENSFDVAQDMKIPEINLSDDSCALFFKNFYDINGFDKMFQDLIYNMISESLGLKETVRFYDNKIKYNKLRDTLMPFIKGKGLANPEFRFSYVYEMYIAKRTGGIRVAGNGIPDIFYFNDKGEIIGIAECKFYFIQKESSKTFFQEINTKHDGKLNSGYNFCKENGLKNYALFFRVIPWINSDLCILLDINGLNKINSFKNNLNQEVLNFQNFNYEEYFKDQKVKNKEINEKYKKYRVVKNG